MYESELISYLILRISNYLLLEYFYNYIWNNSIGLINIYH